MLVYACPRRKSYSQLSSAQRRWDQSFDFKTKLVCTTHAWIVKLKTAILYHVHHCRPTHYEIIHVKVGKGSIIEHLQPRNYQVSKR